MRGAVSVTATFRGVCAGVATVAGTAYSLGTRNINGSRLTAMGNGLTRMIGVVSSSMALRMFRNARNVPAGTRIMFLNGTPALGIDSRLTKQFFGTFNSPVSNNPTVRNRRVRVNNPSMGPIHHHRPSRLVTANVTNLSLGGALMSNRGVPFFTSPGRPCGRIVTGITLHTGASGVVLNNVNLAGSSCLCFGGVFSGTNMLSRVVSFIGAARGPPIRHLLVPSVTLATTRCFTIRGGRGILILLASVALCTSTLTVMSGHVSRVPSGSSVPNSLCSSLTGVCRGTIRFPSNNSVAVVTMAALSNNSVARSVPSGANCVARNRLFLHHSSSVNGIVISPFHSLSHLGRLITNGGAHRSRPRVVGTTIHLCTSTTGTGAGLRGNFSLAGCSRHTLTFTGSCSRGLLTVSIGVSAARVLSIT